MAQRADQIRQNRKWKYLSFGPPKGAGKTSFAMTAPGNKLVLQYDLGSTTIPPGVNPQTVWVQDYPETDRKVLNGQKDKWNRSKVNYEHVIKDLDAVVESFEAGKQEITFWDGTKAPLPDTLILDGLVRLDTIIVDGFCAINNICDPGDAMDSKGKVGGGTQKFWGRRLSNISKMFSLVISLPCNVAALTWEDIKMVKDDFGNIVSQTKEPDIGGKLNVWGPGLFDGCIYQYSAGGKYYVRTQSTPEIQRVGFRDAYGFDALIDVTIDPKKPDPILPFEKVFGKVVDMNNVQAMQKLAG